MHNTISAMAACIGMPEPACTFSTLLSRKTVLTLLKVHVGSGQTTATLVVLWLVRRLHSLGWTKARCVLCCAADQGM